MTNPDLPIGEGSVPDKALEELLAAFADDMPTAENEIDLDDPSINELLGLDEAQISGAATATSGATATGGAATGVPETDAVAAAGAAHDLPTTEQPAVPSTATTVPDVPSVAPASTNGARPVSRTPIKIGGDDELPDPVYLDEEGEERLRGTSGRATEASIREERTTILIGGDEIEGSSGGIPIGTSSATMDPRLRARRIAVKRAVGRRRLKWIIIPVAVVVIFTAGLALLGSRLFAVRGSDIHVSGARRMSPADLDKAVAELTGKAVLLVDTHHIESILEKSPWVRDARVTTDFPHSASIEIAEREPLATYQGTDGRFRIIDVEGRVVDVLAGQPIEFMLINGPALNAEAGGWAGEPFTHAAQVVEALSPGVRARTGSVTVSDTGELALVFRNDSKTEIVLGAPTQLLDKLTRLEALLRNTDPDKCTRIDVTTSDIGKTCSR